MHSKSCRFCKFENDICLRSFLVGIKIILTGSCIIMIKFWYFEGFLSIITINRLKLANVVICAKFSTRRRCCLFVLFCSSIFHCRQKERLQTKLKLDKEALALFYVDACKDCLAFVTSQRGKSASEWHKSRPAKFQDVSAPAAKQKIN
jgi:hypothetical protein